MTINSNILWTQTSYAIHAAMQGRFGTNETKS